ncbi:MAG: FAD-dependent oxidoreductase [Spirochaetia bacterium]|nr:FAD-dependent oxidoreductase [Spirochaetia bacterium]
MVKEITSEEFENIVLKSGQSVALDFYSTECPPCESLAPKYADIADRFSEKITFYKMFRQENRDLALKLGVTSSPTVLFFKDGQETGERLSAAVKKREIINELEKMLEPADFEKLNQKRPLEKKQADLLILGGGPAGLSAALYAAQAKLDTVLIDEGLAGGQVSTTHMISNYPGTGKPIAGYALAHSMKVQAEEAGAKIISAVDVSRVEFSETEQNHKITFDDEIEYEAKAVILAMGAEPRLLGVNGEKELKGKGISYCATCDGKFYEDLELVVIGGGNSAIEESLFLTKFASKITIIHQFAELQANKLAQEKAFENGKINFIFEAEPRKFEKKENKMIVTFENLKTKETSEIITDGVFVFVGMSPKLGSIAEKLNTNGNGYIITDEDMQTNIKGVYAAGDIRQKSIRQAVTAASDGCIAAITAERYINKH